MESVLKSFSEHGTFVQPDAMDYILSKEKPTEFTSLIINNLNEYPLVLTVDQIKTIEQSTTKEISKPPLPILENNELQKKVLSAIYSGELPYKPFIEENDMDYDDPDKDDQIDLSHIDIEAEVTAPQVI